MSAFSVLLGNIFTLQWPFYWTLIPSVKKEGRRSEQLSSHIPFMVQLRIFPSCKSLAAFPSPAHSPRSQFGAQMGQIKSTNRLSPRTISPASRIVTLPNQSKQHCYPFHSRYVPFLPFLYLRAISRRRHRKRYLSFFVHFVLLPFSFPIAVLQLHPSRPRRLLLPRLPRLPSRRRRRPRPPHRGRVGQRPHRHPGPLGPLLDRALHAHRAESGREE